MSVRPLPGASYHTALDAVLHSFANVDPEAVGSLTAYGPSEKMSYCPEECRPLLDDASSTRRRRRGLPVLLALLVLSCLAFVASAFWGYSPLRLLSPNVPERHVPLVDRISTMLHSDLHRMLVNQDFRSAVQTMCVRRFLRPRLVFRFRRLISRNVLIGTSNSNVHTINVMRPICLMTISCGPFLMCTCTCALTPVLFTIAKCPSTL
jgi:hypothetical protein